MQGVALVDLANPIGALACRAPPSVNLTETMSRLTGVLTNISPQQLPQLPDLIKLSVGVKPEALLVRPTDKITHFVTCYNM